MRKASTMTDVILIAENVNIAAHKLVLAASSEYFLAMFTRFDEANKERISIKDINGKALQLLIDYIYTGKIEVSEENVGNLLHAASLLQLNAVVNLCFKFLKLHLNPSNSIKVIALADMYNCRGLFKLSLAFIKNFFSSVAETPDFLKLSCKQLCDIVSNNNLVVVQEETVYHAVLRWINHDLAARSDNISTVMQHVKFLLMEKDFFLEKVKNNPMLTSNEQCQKFISEADKYHFLNSDERLTFDSPRILPRRWLDQLILVFFERTIEAYSFDDHNWFNFGKLPSTMDNYNAAVFGKKIYSVAYGKSKGTIDVFDPLQNTLENVAVVDVERYLAEITVVKNYLYMVVGNMNYDTVICFDVESGEWIKIAPMQTPRQDFKLGALNNFLYAVGGYEDGYSKTVEKYCPDTNSWSYVADLKVASDGTSVAAAQGKLYAFGGRRHEKFLNSVQEYNPVTDIWSIVSKMQVPRCSPAVVSHNDLVYVIGGCFPRDEINRYFQKCEVFDPQTNTCSVFSCYHKVPCSYSDDDTYSSALVIDK